MTSHSYYSAVTGLLIDAEACTDPKIYTADLLYSCLSGFIAAVPFQENDHETVLENCTTARNKNIRMLYREPRASDYFSVKLNARKLSSFHTVSAMFPVMGIYVNID